MMLNDPRFHGLPGKSRRERRDGMPESGRVLIMDDDEAIRITLSALLRSAGFRVTATENGENAVAAYTAANNQGDPYSAVLLDLNVPGGMGGAEAIRRLIAVDPLVGAVVVSGSTEDPAFRNFLSAGFRCALSKPCSGDELLSAVRAAITRGHPRGEPSAEA